jgi:hypothetical protein
MCNGIFVLGYIAYSLWISTFWESLGQCRLDFQQSLSRTRGQLYRNHIILVHLMLIHFEDNKERETNKKCNNWWRTCISISITLSLKMHYLFMMDNGNFTRHHTSLMGLFYVILFIIIIIITDCLCGYCGDACTIKKLREELSRALVEAKEGDINAEGIEIESFDKLVKDMTSKGEDIKAFAFKTKAMVSTRNHGYQFACTFYLVLICSVFFSVIDGMYRVTSSYCLYSSLQLTVGQLARK